MPLHQVAFICSGVLLIPLTVIQVIMRREVHDANYGIGSPEQVPGTCDSSTPCSVRTESGTLTRKRMSAVRFVHRWSCCPRHGSFPLWLLCSLSWSNLEWLAKNRDFTHVHAKKAKEKRTLVQS